ncbi:MAG: hypothetical protein AMJ37_02970 [Dehalococcoidia bacterium DG_18]|nr:MAG: hypothetical protein AMJ37_02970 [Dehalococcoidia bacterium DG_18]
MVTKAEWEAIKKRYGNKCILCGESEKRIGVLEKAHLTARSRGGTQIVPMCPNCHKRYDRKLLNKTDCKKLGIEYEKYVKGKYSPRKSAPLQDRLSRSPWDYWPDINM